MASMRSSPQNIKQWQLASVGLLTGETPMSVTEPMSRTLTSMSNLTRFSAWTPLTNKTFNKQLFHERVNLICHWFDLWTGKQRKYLLQALLMRSSRSQLKFMQDWFTEEVPVAKLDFTTVLPRFISLYIFSFLSPQALCATAQVNWHWRFLSEQDYLWMPKCVKFGWFLPYTPSDNEYGSWKRHYVACVAHLDYLTPREATEIYGTLNEPKESDEEQDEKWREKLLRKMLHDRLAQHKRNLFKTRPPWLSGTWNSVLLKSKSQSHLSQAVSHESALQAALWLIRGKTDTSNLALSRQLAEDSKPISSIGLVLEKELASSSIKVLPKRKNISGSKSYPVPPSRQRVFRAQDGLSCPVQLRLLLISSRVPAYEMVLASIRPNVVPLLYDHSGLTLESLLHDVEKVLDGRRAKTIGIIANGDSGEINLLQGCRISMENVLNSDIRDFWEKLGSCVAPEEGEGEIHLFVPLAASEGGMKVLSQLSHLTGVTFSTPTGTATGSYQHILSEWLGGQRRESPLFMYFSTVKVEEWCRLAQVLEEVLKSVRKQMRPYLSKMQKMICGRMVGQCMFDSMGITKVLTNQETAQALAEGLMDLSRGNCENPLESLALFLLRKCRRNKELEKEHDLETTLSAFLEQEDAKEKEMSTTETIYHLHESKLELLDLDSNLQGYSSDKRTSFAREILGSERTYVQMLEIVREVYAVPLKAALASNRAILSFANVQIIFSDILAILELNRRFLGDLAERLQEWGPAQCLGDVFTKFGMQLKTYTNFFNNYAVILKTIDKCRETIPHFRAFLKRHDNTVVTKMMTLQELLLFPSTRFEEYVYLLYALRLHTPPEHADREDLTAAVKQMKQYRDYTNQLKQKVDNDDKMLNTQKIIQGCPNLLEANRHLLRVQNVALLSCYNEDICASLRCQECFYSARS
uniref:Epithelial cell-transforming sequence 2 oncogene-like isoform X2 n=1 Tax=Geotrypetes seraphini TaxID=260995 RepID=A0A6P8QAB2_GEOSA|nr:epithelial cell-transforming sequence 2 oncogene-like isoform X2 [Geotrypetes seraphini]